MDLPPVIDAKRRARLYPERPPLVAFTMNNFCIALMLIGALFLMKRWIDIKQRRSLTYNPL